MSDFLREKQAEFRAEICKENPNLDVIRNILMLHEGIDINVADPNGQVALIHQAARFGAQDLLLICLSRGADPNVQTSLGRAPIHFAAAENRSNIIDVLVRNKHCNINIKSLAGLTALHLACRGNKRDAVMSLTSQNYHDLELEAESPDRKRAIEMTTSRDIKFMIEKYQKKKSLAASLPVRSTEDISTPTEATGVENLNVSPAQVI
eukprot:GDKJ01023249.1.p1 GENE.GDKJ01023249.1~~GDKJ01023249.1.p1  ORF type:complete len:207 (+),score=37.03 GDKJ01023249.1:27-647(+)